MGATDVARAIPPWQLPGYLRNKMNRSDLIDTLHAKNGLVKMQCDAVLNTLIDTIQNAVKNGDTV
ncbi:hypothetical protein AcdelDRAFT_0015 [Acidovorax delafieldii 2AN]|uniref:Uncharacterized protein n=1 Tax=Acidovorax delafieldii 2AN TaxID=573060 RepID=C5SZD5_ACIDE|nr:hypothetical protein AcdelDRAFT_0015 [Acidovorax delafieldii 2AN]